MDSAHPQTVLSKLNEQRSQGLFCDVTIVVEDVKFRAHKNILAACSGYFRNALTAPETWSSSQVLELLDLKSEVFASILNFIYCSKVTSPGAEDTGGLLAAGKKLGIPFLERLADQERQDSCNCQTLSQCVKSTDCTALLPKKTKKEPPRVEEIDTTRGPRITNAFSINEICPGNNPFTPLVQTKVERQSPDVRQLPPSCATTSCFRGNNETTHTLSEHSYAVNQATEGNNSTQWDNRKICKPVMSQPIQVTYRNAGPLKKRHSLRAIMGRNTVLVHAQPHTDKPNTADPTSFEDLTTESAVVPSSPLYSEAEVDKHIETLLPVATDRVQMELNPPTLSPHTEEIVSVYRCEHCTDIFPNKALFNIHSQLHKKHFPRQLLCKFCHRKFIHLKRLQNHEQVCLKAAAGHHEVDASGKSTKEEDLDSGDVPKVEDITRDLPTGNPTSYKPEPLQVDQLKTAQDKMIIKSDNSLRGYNCSVCKRVYVTLSSLKRHENVHSWQRAYPCHYCNKVFALAEYRTKHEIWHTGERRYQCIFCLETFMTYYILKNHQKSFHGIDPTLAVQKKSANGGLKASVYPIKLYRLLPMKFRKRLYKTYSKTYSESTDRGNEIPVDNNTPLSPFEGKTMPRHAESVSFPLTFMATTKMVAPVMPHISFDKASDKDTNQSLSTEMENCHQIGSKNKNEHKGSPFDHYENILALQSVNKDDALDLINSKNISPKIPLLNSLNTVKKLGELSASAKQIEDMTKEMLQSGTEDVMLDKTMGAKTETYIAKPACPGPSVDGDPMPLCQITVKIGNEAIIRRRIKGSKLFPKKKRKFRELREFENPGQHHPTQEKSGSPRLRLRPDVAATTGAYDDANDCDLGDELWRPYYSYKAKKKRKKLRFKHSQALFQHYPTISINNTDACPSDARVDGWKTEKSISDGVGEIKTSLSKICSAKATYNCDICDSSFITETGLRAHIIGSHPCFCHSCGKQGPPGEAPAGCDYICNNCMEKGSCFDNSSRSLTTEKKFRCSFCPQRFLYLATKRSHEKKHQDKTEERYTVQVSGDMKKVDIKTEETQNQETTEMGCMIVKGGRFPRDETKIEDTTSCTTPYDNFSYSHIKTPVSSSTNLLFSVKPSEVKYKMDNRQINVANSMQLKLQARDRNRNKDSLIGPKTTSLDPEKSCKLSRKNDYDAKGNHISVQKPEK